MYKPGIKSNDILVEVKAASLKPIDYKLVEGHLKDKVALNLPFTIGYDLSGVIVEKGIDVNNFEIGDKIFARVPQEQMGTVAEYVAVTTEVVARKPGNYLFFILKAIKNSHRCIEWSCLIAHNFKCCCRCDIH